MRTALLILGTVLLALGIFGLLTGGISFTHQKDVVSSGPLHIRRDATSHIALSPAFNVIILLAGGGLVVAGLRQR